MPLLVGTSGWQYRDWRGVLYPPGTPLAHWLEYYSQTFPTVENNGTFYRLPAPETFAAWRARTPAGFLMAIKASRYLTHVRRLREPAEPVDHMLGAAAHLGPRLGPVLMQLPPTMAADPAALDGCLDAFSKFRPPVEDAGAWAGVRVAVEFRHESWFTEQTRDVLASHNAALCWADRQEQAVSPLWRTADWGYLRLHEGADRHWPRYRRKALSGWVSALAGNWQPGEDVFVFFNNDQGAAAPHDASAFGVLAKDAGLRVLPAPPVAPVAPG